jgi:uncharacterized protein
MVLIYPENEKMKFQPDLSASFYINSYGPDWLAVNGERHEGSALVSSIVGIQNWPYEKVALLTVEAFEQIAQLDVEIVLFGSGDQLIFPQAALIKPLILKGIGVETMDTPAACRTFNVLAAEGRKVVAAILFGGVSKKSS